MAVLFDTLKTMETLQSGGFTDQQARAKTAALSEAADTAQVATRGDVMDLGIGMKHDFEAFKLETRADFEAFKAEMRANFEAFKVEQIHGMAALEQRLTIRLGGIVVASCGVLFAALHFFH